ncbi:MAG: hemerythrin family protein [Thermodesulfobacteriota bacterium]
MENLLYIVWQPGHEIGIPIVDEQHRGIVSTINSFYYFFQRGDAATVYKPTLDVLHHYAALHFSTEEALMRAAGYQSMGEHVALHSRFADQVHAMTVHRTHEGDVEDLLVFLRKWWLGHISNEDRKYAAVVRKHLDLL